MSAFKNIYCNEYINNKEICTKNITNVDWNIISFKISDLIFIFRNYKFENKNIFSMLNFLIFSQQTE